MKKIAAFLIFFAASFVIGPLPIIAAVALVYGLACLFSRGGPTKPKTHEPPPFGGISRKFHL